MSVTLTIKNVPDEVADALRQRAKANRRSLQRELLVIAEEVAGQTGSRVTEPAPPAYVPTRGKAATKASASGGRLNLDQLWQRARRLGSSHPAESTAIVRADRDARDRR